MTTREALIGIDVGTQGVRVVATDPEGTVISSRQHPFLLQTEGDAREQSPENWWETLLPLLRETASALASPGVAARPMAISVTSTSGTVIPLAADHTPLHAALMYDDLRSASQAVRCQRAAADAGFTELGIGPSFGLPKMLWYAETFPGQAGQIALWAHAADYVVGRLSGAWGVTDPTNALKTGYDPGHGAWPAYITGALGVPAHWLPQVIPSGSQVGTLRPEAAAATGLPSSLPVMAGMTDGCASQIAAGAVRPGEWSSTIGTTLVLKGVTRHPILDPEGRVYNHRHPEGWWLPGGASNTGAAWIAQDFPDKDLAGLDAQARELIPTPWTAYPLRSKGERFPFFAPNARGFEPEGLAPMERYAARMEGVAYLERLAFDLVESLSGEPVARVSTAGGASRAETWLTIRANVLGKPIARMRYPDAAFGAAILAASGGMFDGLAAAARSMTRIDSIIEPGALATPYAEGYARFVSELTRRGYLQPEETLA